MFLSLYDFFNPAGSSGEVITKIGVTWQYWLPVILSLIALACLFIFKTGYVKLAQNKLFLRILGIFQIFLYFLYYFLHFLYLYYFKESGKNLRGWPWIFPFHLSSITQIISGILLIKANDKLFSITAPWVVIMVFASLLIPADKSYGPQHFSYWLYYVLHVIIIFTYWFLYMYGIVQYHRDYLLWSFISLIIFSLMALSFNAFSLVIAKNENEITNLLFIGRDGYPLWGSGNNLVTTANIFDRTGRLWPLGYIFIFTFGIFFTSLGYLILTKVQPYFSKKGNKFVPLKRVKQPWDFKALGIMFLNIKTIFKK
ncbi:MULTISPECIES: hypothetical protein [unclassified Spiroplasma]|uniref:TMEM164 family acyltransferase n=1 Tax=unclassified Spiroplasma TaxID=2637901 RepID=UPI00313F05C5